MPNTPSPRNADRGTVASAGRRPQLEAAKAMRNAWRAIKLFEELPGQGVVLHLAALERTIDITTPDGRMSAYIQTFLDDL